MVVVTKGRNTMRVRARLLGQNVRRNSGHSLDLFITEAFLQYVPLFSACPEVEHGLQVLKKAITHQWHGQSENLIQPRHALQLMGWHVWPAIFATFVWVSL
jgi:uncharacterized protein YbbK (DUF523 family)